MTIYNDIIGLLHKLDKRCPYIQTIVNAISIVLTVISDKIEEIYLNFFFDSLNLNGVKYFEKLLKITPLETQSIEDRRSAIRAKWLQDGHNNIFLIQLVCDSWRYGDVDADYKNGKLQLKFINTYGVPSDLDGLKRAIDEVKPTYIPYETIFKYLLIKDIHEVKTIDQMQALTIKMFAAGREDV